MGHRLAVKDFDNFPKEFVNVLLSWMNDGNGPFYYVNSLGIIGFIPNNYEKNNDVYEEFSYKAKTNYDVRIYCKGGSRQPRGLFLVKFVTVIPKIL